MTTTEQFDAPIAEYEAACRALDAADGTDAEPEAGQCYRDASMPWSRHGRLTATVLAGRAGRARLRA